MFFLVFASCAAVDIIYYINLITSFFEMAYQVSEEGETLALNEEDKFHISYGRKLSQSLDESQLELLYAINDALIKQPNELQTVADLLEISLEG